MANVFRFKQFSVDQTGCAMKINTDGVLLGALADADQPLSILDIGTGTGVIALMLAQRFTDARINAIEIDESAALTAESNFKNSPFAERLTLYTGGFEAFFQANPDRKYDLIVSNPPFYINSLQSPGMKKNLAKHAGEGFFEVLVSGIASHLSNTGTCWLILPPDTAALVKQLAKNKRLNLQKIIVIHSFKESEQHREILVLGLAPVSTETAKLIIYESVGVYTDAYKTLLKPYFIAF